MRVAMVALLIMAGACCARRAGGEVVFFDGFDTPGTQLDLAKWTTEFGPPSFLGRTQLRDWVAPAGVGDFNVLGGEAKLSLNTFNPTGFSLYGTHAKSLMSFQPTSTLGYELEAKIKLETLQPGLVIGLYFLGCDGGPCGTNHDELDIEIVTNFLDDVPPRVQLNRYANEPLGAGHGPIVALPAGFDPLESHIWTIRWEQDQATFLLDGAVLFVADTFIPQGSMQANLIIWGPAPEWPDAYDTSLQPVSDSAQNQQFIASVDYLVVRAVPEPGSLLQTLTGIGTLIAGATLIRLRSVRRSR